MTITFADTVPTEAFEKLDGVGQVESLPDGHTLRMTAQGGIDAIVKVAAHYSVVSLSNHEPSLEEVFLRYYEGDGLAAKEASHVVQ